MGTGLSTIGFLILAKYFNKKRGKANTIFMMGSGVSLFVSPLLIRHLQVEFGYTGAIMITGAFCLHGFLGSCLFQPVEWHMKYPTSFPTKADSKSLSALQRNNNLYSREKVSVCIDSAVKKEETSKHSLSDNTSLSSSKVASVPKNMLSSTIRVQKTLLQRRAHELRHTIKSILHFIAKDLAILKQPSGLIIAVGSAIVINAQSNFVLMVPFAIKAKGHSLQTVAWCLSMTGICNLVTRLIVSPLSDYPWFRMKLVYNLSIAAMATAIICKFI